MTLLNLKNITIDRQASPLLRFMDLSIEPHSKTLLLGPSGSGKTTLLSILAGLLKPTTGQVLFEGQNFYDMPAHVRDGIRGRRLGFVFQTLHLLPSLTLRQNIVLAADMAGIKADKERLESLLKDLGLADKAHRKPEALSQGEQQRAAIARAVINRPSIIIADEPTSALDDENARAVIDLIINQSRQTGAALLIATHDTRIVKNFETIVQLGHSMKEAA